MSLRFSSQQTSSTMGFNRESNPSRKMYNLRVVPQGRIADSGVIAEMQIL